MKSLMAVLAKLGLISSVDADEVTAATEVTAKFNELQSAASSAQSEVTQVKAKLGETETKLNALTKAHATTVVEGAILAGRIPGQNEEVKAKWVGLIKADPANASLFPEPNPALVRVIKPTNAKDAAKGGLNGDTVHPFMAKVHEFVEAKKSTEAFAIEAVARTKDGAKLYEEYRQELYGIKK